jgi:hypothetical protein
MHSRAVPVALALITLAGAGSARAQGRGATRVRQLAPASTSRVARELSVLAADSLEGRETGSRGSATAARFIAQALREAGLTPAGDSGYFQRVSVAWSTVTVQGQARRRRVLLPSLASLAGVPPADRLSEPAVNVVGLLRGSDPALEGEAIVVTAHYDHLGIGPAVNGDSIYNGADDDASGTVAVMEIARALARARPAPKRTVVFLLVTGEERGLLGTRWYLDHPVVPLARTVANLNIEMIARPDSLAGGSGKAWLTGYDRSTMGVMLRDAGIPIVPDPRLEQHFFERSDNIAFARRGIPAHTLSSFNLHADYHEPSDEASRADPAHMARVIAAAARAVALLADGPAPAWTPGDPLAGARNGRAN